MFPEVLFIVFGEQRVKERVDAAVGEREACGQVVDVSFDFGGEGQ